MTKKLNPSIDTVKIRGIKPRTAAAVKQYLDSIKGYLTKNSLLDVVQNSVRLAVPEAYKQLSMNRPIQRELQEQGLVKPGGITISILNPVEISSPDDINNFIEGRYNTTVIKINNDLQLDGHIINSGDFLRVARIERVKQIIHFSSLLSKAKYSLSADSIAFKKTMDKADFYYESEMSFCEGDIVSQLEEPNHLYQITNIRKTSIIKKENNSNPKKEDKIVMTLTDINGNKFETSSDSIKARSLSLAYASSGKRAIGFKNDITVILIDGDDKSTSVKEFIKVIISQSESKAFIFGVEKTLRKSVQVVCPSEVMESVESVVEKIGTTHRKYVESLIDDFLSVVESVPQAKDSFSVLYSSPPLSKANAFWISETHYDRLKSFCDESGFKVNPLAHHLIFSDLIRRNKVKLDDRLISLSNFTKG